MTNTGTARSVAVVWDAGPVRGTVEVANGALARLATVGGTADLPSGRFSCPASGPCRLELDVEAARLDPGPGATIVTIRAEGTAFSFFLRDVGREYPIYVRAYGVAVTDAADRRSYDELAAAVRARGLVTGIERLEREPEETFDGALAATRALRCPTWLGLGRDIRIFEVAFHPTGGTLMNVRPRLHGTGLTLPEAAGAQVSYDVQFGRGFGCVDGVTRRLEDGVLPILHAQLDDGEVRYEMTAFADLERTPLAADSVTGTHFLVAHAHGLGHMLTDGQRERCEALRPDELDPEREQTVLRLRVEALNTAAVPRYAFFRAPAPVSAEPPRSRYDAATGQHSFESGRVFAASRLDGQPAPQEELAVLVAPGGRAVWDLCIPHSPVSAERAAALAAQDFDERREQCRAFWTGKLERAAAVRVPDRRVTEMTRAGLLHLDLVAYGREPDGPIAPTIGVYSPIGTESAPIIQFMDSMGWHEEARRAVEFFFEMQHDDGFMQNFGGYMAETGAALWTAGEHYRYTRDDAWAGRVAPKVLKSCEFLLDWRRRNMRDELRGRGYGMIEGKVADPEDPYHAYMLNGYAYVGMKRAAEMLRNVSRDAAARLAAEAEAWRADIRASLAESFGRGPLVPLGDGSWSPTCAPWAEGRGPVCLYADGGRWWSHGTFGCRDSLLGPAYLIANEVVEPSGPAADFLLDAHHELLTLRNVAYSQPYYSRHDLAHLRRGEVGAFLKTYFNAAASLADRETYTFWEHYFHVSPHKTHEEAWFLMQTRWMLYLEEGETLNLLPGVPRCWMAHGNCIELENVASYFGPASLRVESRLDEGLISAVITCPTERRPAQVRLRIPHPDRRAPRSADGGRHDPESESVLVRPVRGENKVVLRY